VQSHRIFRQGLRQRTLSDGTNGLVRRARLVEIVRPSLLRQLPPPVDEGVVLLGGVDLWSFHKSAGPQAWYRSARVRVCDLADLRWAPDDLYVEDPIEFSSGPKTRRVSLGRRPFHAFRLSDGQLERVAAAQLEELARRQSGAAREAPQDDIGRRSTR
jgi:hypothetical protein